MNRIINSRYSQLRYSSAILLIIAFMANCKKNETQLPPKTLSPSLDSLASAYSTLLTSQESGWFLLYQPNDSFTATAIRIKFHPGNKLSIIAGLKDYQSEQTDMSYSFDGEYALQIVFPDSSVFGALENIRNGYTRFKMTLLDNGDFQLKRGDGYDNKTITLTKVNADNTQLLNDQVQQVWDQIAYEAEIERLKAEARLKLRQLKNADSGYYYYNLLTAHFGAYIDQIDTLNALITLRWKQTTTAPEMQHTLQYAIIPGGMAFSPAITYGTYIIDTLHFGEFKDGALSITNAGNAGAGHLGWMHIPAYPYQTAVSGAPANYTTADYFVRNNELPRFMGYTLDDMDTYYSPTMQTYMDDLRNYFINEGFKADELLRLQFYNNNYNGTTIPDDPAHRNQLQILVRNSMGTSTFLVFFYELEKAGPNHVVIRSLGTSNTGSAPYIDKVTTFMNKIFTSEGFTVVPAGRNGTSPTALQKIRLVSRKDSRIWIELLVTNFTTPVYFDE